MKTAYTAMLALALATLVAAPARAAPGECTPAGDCTQYKNLVTFPAHALSYGFAPLTLHPSGIDWPDNGGEMTLTVRRPPDFHGDKIRLTLAYQTTSGESGSHAFAVTAIAFHHGSGFETYGGFLSDSFDVPGDPTGLYEQSVTIEPGLGWNPDGPWWYFEIGRQGSYNNSLRVMAVTLEY